MRLTRQKQQKKQQQQHLQTAPSFLSLSRGASRDASEQRPGRAQTLEQRRCLPPLHSPHRSRLMLERTLLQAQLLHRRPWKLQRALDSTRWRRVPPPVAQMR
jgi:hypothetical protein